MTFPVYMIFPSPVVTKARMRVKVQPMPHYWNMLHMNSTINAVKFDMVRSFERKLELRQSMTT